MLYYHAVDMSRFIIYMFNFHTKLDIESIKMVLITL